MRILCGKFSSDKVAGLGSFYGAYIFDRINRIYMIEISWGISSSLEFKFENGAVR